MSSLALGGARIMPLLRPPLSFLPVRQLFSPVQYMVINPIFYVNPYLGHLYSSLLAYDHYRYTRLSTQRTGPVIF